MGTAGVGVGVGVGVRAGEGWSGGKVREDGGCVGCGGGGGGAGRGEVFGGGLQGKTLTSI